MAFYECKSLTEIMIGSGLTLKKTGPKLLRYSQTIKTVEFPSTLKVVDCHAFKCDQISTIRSRSVTPAQLMWSNPAFMGGMMAGKSTDPFPNECTFYVPATDVSILPREMSRSDRGVRNREALSVFPNPTRGRKKKRPGYIPRSLKNVRAKGLEPIRTKAPDPKSGLATNYNTLANPFRKTHNMKPIAEYDLVGSCRILCPKRNAKIVKDFQFTKRMKIFEENTEKKHDICASKM